jgi:hypothetical protein
LTNIFWSRMNCAWTGSKETNPNLSMFRKSPKLLGNARKRTLIVNVFEAHKLLCNTRKPTLIINVSKEHKLLCKARKPTLIVNVFEEHKLFCVTQRKTNHNCQCF